ncbi:hypothetical protein PGH12_01440 [Chryseobacterium wangxinyae]|uniref:hypothetical protein n=1 Tax=Chryseobacterium sp. CY350 TaxID=2997336 RepID=UPI00226F970C|nr:hypothetical protein [Chryseobacterium sp. CY350]MCY0977155.1 hypothetical protein [Chryseobacterium sp. CY350]WBZ95824.1 hypothetical protein PGH12_01440 [Chryseobacterium sp. CY350]
MRQDNKIIDFFGNVIKDRRMTAAHISIYIALFQIWRRSNYQISVRISRKEVMKLGKIKSFATYHKCIKELDDAGFINYSPNYNSFVGSCIEIIDFANGDCRKNKVAPDSRKVSRDAVFFSVPMIHEVELYFNERDLASAMAHQFYSLYQSKNWNLMDSKPMKCWKSAARCWILKHKNKNQTPHS